MKEAKKDQDETKSKLKQLTNKCQEPEQNVWKKLMMRKKRLKTYFIKEIRFSRYGREFTWKT